MAAEISDRVREIAEARGLPESEVLERALERGPEDLREGLYSHGISMRVSTERNPDPGAVNAVRSVSNTAYRERSRQPS